MRSETGSDYIVSAKGEIKKALHKTGTETHSAVPLCFRTDLAAGTLIGLKVLAM